jgi:hypothetical protein
MRHKINEIYVCIQIAIWQQESENRSRTIRNKQTQIPVRNGKGNIESDSNGYNSRRLHFKSRTVMEHGNSCMVYQSMYILTSCTAHIQTYGWEKG